MQSRHVIPTAFQASAGSLTLLLGSLLHPIVFKKVKSVPGGMMMTAHHKLYRPLSVAVIFLVLLIAGSWGVTRAFDGEAQKPISPAGTASISGTVTYAVAVSTTGVPNATMTLTGPPNDMMTTSASGTYSFPSVT